VFDQRKPQVSLDTIVPDLATSWSWNKDDTALTFQLRQDVKWHDGKPFTLWGEYNCPVIVVVQLTGLGRSRWNKSRFVQSP
jgi:hypothetical protein